MNHRPVSIKDVVNAIVPITRFNRGEASKIFDEVNETGAKVVLKNNAPACVLVKPEQYNAMVEALEDYALFLEAEKRVAGAAASGYIQAEQVQAELGISDADIAGVQVDIE